MGPKVKELLLPLAVVVFHLGICTAFEIPFFGGRPNIEILNGSNSSVDPDSKLHLLMPHIFIIPLNQLEAENMIPEASINFTGVPSVEFEKLKNSAKTAGLSEPKADRLVRAAKIMNMTFDELAEARKILSSPTTSADFADQVRQKSFKFYTHGGLKQNETQRLVRAIMQSNMNSTHVNNLVDVMTQHAPTTADLNLLADHLESNGTSNSNGTFKSNVTNNVDKQGNSSAWFSVPLPQDQESQRKARESSVDSFIFSSTRNCGVSPQVVPSRLSNVAAASCILNYKKNNLALKIVLGAWSFPPDASNSQPQLAVYSKAAVLHPSYVEGSADIKNNIGLIRLYEEVNFDQYPHIFPICIVGLSIIDPKALSNQCKVQGWPNLQNVDTKHAKSFIAGGEVQTNTTGCTPANSCVTGTACKANEGSAVACPGSSLRYYQWGIVASQPKCAPGASVSVSTVSIFDNYDFILNYLKAPNPNSA
ncbi:unnamed protein product [Allacma fusca]|uniref:Peptidase S1 domain-containing protein n=1 Tax=Allacma fusca TaxID=39272 RepID=A0A8J2J8F2_9HEXA|nr:unnamed protein product [Allacma fusca]